MTLSGFRNLRLAARSVSRRPAHSALIVVTLALGLGAATAMFTLLQQVILRPLPVRAQDEVVVAWGHHTARGFDRYPLNYAAFERIRESGRSFVGVAGTDAWGSSERLLEEADGVTPVRWSRVMGDFFGLLGVNPALGRIVGPDDDRPGAQRAVVISHGLWQRRWGGRSSAIGGSLTMDGEPYTVVGVLPRGFDYPRGTEVWSALRAHYPDWASERPWLELHLVGRLTGSASPSGAAAEIERLLAEDPQTAAAYGDVEWAVRPFPEVVLGDLRPGILILFAGALLVLAVACLDVTHLLMVRAAEIEGDMAIRRALGAQPWRLLRDTLTEGLLLGVLAGVASAVLAVAAVRLIPPLAPAGLPRLGEVNVELPTYLFVAGLTLVLVALIAAVPVIRTRRLDPAVGLRAVGHIAGRRGSGRHALVIAQTALAVCAVAAVALMYRTLHNLESLDLGFDDRGLMLVQLDHDYPFFGVPQDFPDRLATVARRLEANPAIESVTPALAPPQAGNAGFDVVPTLEDARSADEVPYLSLEVALPGYFETLGLPLVRGRALSREDVEGAMPAVVVNSAAARSLWPGEDGLGKRLSLPFPGYEDIWWTVVGVAADARYRELLDVRPAIYLPLEQFSVFAPRHLILRTRGPVEVIPLVEEAFAEVDPSVRMVRAVPLPDRLVQPLARPRFSLAVFGALGLVVLTLAGVGVFGVMATVVANHREEMGIRMALGARPADVGRLVLGRGMRVATLGAALGIVLALSAGRLLDALLFDVTPSDPLSLTVAAVVVLAVAATACAAPALRAARTDPIRILRWE